MQDTATNLRSDRFDIVDLDAVTLALEGLLMRHHSVLKAENLESQVKNLKCWLEENRDGLGASQCFPETCNTRLANICNGLKLALEEKQRLEGEGGPPASKEQTEQNEELLHAIRRIEKILRR